MAEADDRMCALDFQAGLTATMDFVRRVNGYVTEQQPSQLTKDEARAADLDRVLYATAESLRAAAILLNPVRPQACARLWEALGARAALGSLATQQVQDAGHWGQLPAGTHVSRLAPLFPRLEESTNSRAAG